tara:strand:+ start:774 stop:1358 length:585 start_codon:yes stop_codon:yes gene_type:complete
MYKRVTETYKPIYQQHIWNDNKFIKESHNCYAYFLNDINHNLKNIYEQEDEQNRKILNPQPGHYCGMTKRVNYKETTCENLINRVLCDNNNIKVIDSMNDNFDCGPNHYKGALLINPEKSYHFYREDEGGMWSHKDGGNIVTNLDYSGNKINDPKYSDTGEYTKFCSYFCVPNNDHSKTNMARNNFYKDKLWYN